MMKNNKFEYYKGLIRVKNIKLIKYKEIIQNVIKNRDINPNIIYGIVMLEYLNRYLGLNHVIEIILYRLIPKFIIDKDMSVGIAQMRISTILKFKNDNTAVILNNLMNNEEAVKLCSEYIIWLFDKYELSNYKSVKQIELVSYLFTTGKISPKINQSINLYVKLLNYIVKSDFI